MAYFDAFENVRYDYTIQTDTTPEINIVQDLMRRYSYYIDPLDVDKFTEPYLVQEGMTPEAVAHKVYGDINLHWTIMFVNGICDIYSEWPMTNDAVVEYTKTKYGVNNIHNVHHWERIPEMMEVGQVVYTNGVLDTSVSGLVFLPNNMATYSDVSMYLSDTFEYVTYTNLDYETRENELKKYIKVIRPAFISNFIKLYNQSVLNG